MSKSVSYALTILATVFLVALIAGGYYLGNKFAFKDVGKVTRNINMPVTLHFAMHRHDADKIDDPAIADMYASLYELEKPTREKIETTLQNVVWEPALTPEPFVGHKLKKDQQGLMQANIHGFRDGRDDLSVKPEDVVRIFITGGSVAFGAGAKSDADTISAYFEKMLNDEVAPKTGYRYQVINTGIPAWATTQERILIENKLVDLKPDVILMFSGNNDVHWALIETEDPANFWSYYDRNFVLLVNNTNQKLGYGPAVADFSLQNDRPSCGRVAEVAKRNVSLAAHVTEMSGAKLIFALQPNIFTSGKILTAAEQKLVQRYRDGAKKEKPIWLECYQDLRDELGAIDQGNYEFRDFSTAFSHMKDDREVFLDAYHFANLGNREIAKAFLKQIDWSILTPAAGMK
ncbi:hypothetical protein RYZ26_14620 [Terasakiella sp. A23]|uniref:SGNH/GDSL hydrolase family protein n=1 Tax=Terasakiella sp. FCG-A23 TaxID=3080561 RepID=UPI002953AB10|nr:SGNH/GDSL hydrolase family protein [Terasakiella sp. A23]MDV7340837.1 hypothetical protein [Terasakiella sp. A23]